MGKKQVEHAVKVLPDVISKMGDYLKDSGNSILKAFSSNYGTIGLVVKIFGQPLIDKYFEQSEKAKLENCGLNTYLKASLKQAGASMKTTLGALEDQYSIDAIEIALDKIVSEVKEKIQVTEFTLFFQPKYHPVIHEVDNAMTEFLWELGVTQTEVGKFRVNFYEEIELAIKNEFGESYQKHTDEIRELIFSEAECELLQDNINIARIGFSTSENLLYEEAYGQLLPVSSLYSNNLNKISPYQEDRIDESGLMKIENLIDNYFSPKESFIDHILFAIADFGKGKSTFLKQYAAKLSKEYTKNGFGYFPIYFNLRNFKDYSEDHLLGVVGNYLESTYGIKMGEKPFVNKRFVFLLDSLDESGDLSQINVDRVISSIKKIQNVDPLFSKFNKIIVTSRPFDNGLKKHLESHNPYVVLNSQHRPVEHYVSFYGFKKEQFNEWLSNSLKSVADDIYNEASGFNKQLLMSIKQDIKPDIHTLLLSKSIISASELRRPIFSYMIFQLIKNSINFDNAGKIGIYLSFLNLLTKEAKYVHDLNYKINLKEQFQARNILHYTAAIWLLNRNSSNSSEIRKASICRAIEGGLSNESDSQILNRYKEDRETEIEFLSHSYFGENNSVLHFQHQSFAEILVAEYYLKVLIKYALDDEFDYEQARIKLTLGPPTEQTIRFFEDLLNVLKESVQIENIQQRKLLFPLLCSIATRSNNKSLYSNFLNYRWLSNLTFEENISDYPGKGLDEWPITNQNLSKITELCKKIIQSDANLLIQTGEFKSSLYNNEVFKTYDSKFIKNTDKFIALLTGNVLYTNVENKTFFNRMLNIDNLVDLLRNLSSVHSWSKKYFLGMDFSSNSELIYLSKVELRDVNFSNSILKGLSFYHANLNYSDFSNAEINYCDFGFASIRRANFYNCKIRFYQRFALSIVEQGVYFPYQLAYSAWQGKKNDTAEFNSHEFAGILSNFGDNLINLNRTSDDDLESIARLLGNLLHTGYNENIWTKQEIIDSVLIENPTKKKRFIDNLFKILENKELPDSENISNPPKD